MNKLLVLALAAGMSPLAFANGNIAFASTDASVTILHPVYASFKNTSLDFGKVVVSGPGVSLKIQENGKVITNGPADVLWGTKFSHIPTLTLAKDPAQPVHVHVTPFMVHGRLTMDQAAIANIDKWARTTNNMPWNDFPLYGDLKLDDNFYGKASGKVMVRINYF